MFYSPFSQPTEYISPDGKGIYLKPHSEANAAGWGEPRLNEDGTPITPGTVGGPFSNVLINKQKGVYKPSANKYMQYGGNISWWGDWRSTTNHAKGRHVLSYNGPKLRYFKEDGFSYGAEQKHNEIYFLGSYAAVAPGPVLGAGMKQVSYYDPQTQTTKPGYFIYVVCYKGGEDKFYRKRWDFAIIRPDKMTDEVRAKAMSLYDTYDNPTGWEPIGSFPRQGEAFAPETPWFFNKSCTEAVTVRRMPKEFDNGHETITEDAFDRYKAAISVDSASVTNLNNSNPFDYVEKITKEHPVYNQPEDHMGFPHTWQEDHVKVIITIKGSQYMMGDYIEDTLYWGKIKYDINRNQTQYNTKGTDPPSYVEVVNGQPQNISNYNLRVGPRYLDLYEYGYAPPTPYQPHEADHEYTVWINVAESVLFYYGPEGNDETSYIEIHRYDTGTSDEWAGNPRQENNLWLFYYQFYTRWMRGFLDIRELVAFSYDIHKYGLWQSGGSTASRTLEHKDVLYREVEPAGTAYRSVKQSSTKNISFGWTLQRIDDMDPTVSNTLNRTTYEAKWPTDNNNAEIQEPGNKTFYANDESNDLKNSWPTIPELFYGPKNSCKGNGVGTDRSEVGFSVEVPDVENEGKFVLVSDMKPAGKPATVVGYGEKFYPVGTC